MKGVLPAILILLPFWLDASNVSVDVIRQKYNSGSFRDVATLLNQLRNEQPELYDGLPFSLMRAKALFRAGDFAAAMAAFVETAENPSMEPFVLLPLARLAADQGHTALATESYQKYLSIRTIPDFSVVAREALDYCFRIQKPDALRQTAEVVRRQVALRRLAEFYMGKSYLLRGDAAQARSFFLNLIRRQVKDDVTSMALTELDALEGKDLGEADRISRAKLAYGVWNFELTRKYLEPYAMKEMENAYYYARSLAHLGRSEEARKVFQAAIGLWPDDRMARLCMYQYANFLLRSGDNQGAAGLYSRLRKGAGGDILENSTFNLVQALRAQSKLNEAVQVVTPYCSSRKRSQRERAVFLRTRVYFQGGKYKEALIDVNKLIGSRYLNDREIRFWKAMILEKMGLPEEASDVFATLIPGDDFFAIQVYDRLAASGKGKPERSMSLPDGIRLCRLPDSVQESAIKERAAERDFLTPFLYLHLYEEAARVLTSITGESWRILDVDAANRRQRLLSVAYLAGLGRNYPVSTYNTEIFLKTLPAGTHPLTFPQDVLRALFPLPYFDMVRKFTETRKVDPLLVISIMKQESKFKELARSQAFARGLMQLIPSTASAVARDLGITEFTLDHLYQPEVNINLGTRYMQNMIDKFGSRVEVIAASYNSGESNVRRWLSITGTDEIIEFYSNIDLPETKNYVNIVKTSYEWYRRIYG